MKRKPKYRKPYHFNMVKEEVSQMRPALEGEELKAAYLLAFEKYGSLIHKPTELTIFK